MWSFAFGPAKRSEAGLSQVGHVHLAEASTKPGGAQTGCRDAMAGQIIAVLDEHDSSGLFAQPQPQRPARRESIDTICVEAHQDRRSGINDVGRQGGLCPSAKIAVGLFRFFGPDNRALGELTQRTQTGDPRPPDAVFRADLPCSPVRSRLWSRTSGYGYDVHPVTSADGRHQSTVSFT